MEFKFLVADPPRAGFFYEHRQDPVNQRFNPLMPSTIESLRERLSKASSDWTEFDSADSFFWFIEYESKLAGIVSVQNINRMMLTAEIGYGISPELRGQGLATEVVRALTREAFERTPLRKLIAFVHEENQASRRVLEKVGYKNEGLLREHFSAFADRLKSFVKGDVRDSEICVGSGGKKSLCFSYPPSSDETPQEAVDAHAPVPESSGGSSDVQIDPSLEESLGNVPVPTSGAAKKRSGPSGVAAVVKTDGAIVYRKPDFDSDVLINLAAGQAVRVSRGTVGSEETGRFHKVRAGNKLGYIADIDVTIEGGATTKKKNAVSSASAENSPTQQPAKNKKTKNVRTPRRQHQVRSAGASVRSFRCTSRVSSAC